MVKTVSISGIALALAIVAFKGYAVHHDGPESTIKQEQPQLLAPQVFDFGDVYANGNVTQNLKLRNGGAGDLTVKKLVPSCGCIVPKEDHRVLKSGEEWSASLTLSAGPNLGVFTRRLAILSDDPKSPERVIELRANVVRDFALMPPSVILGSKEGVGGEAVGEVVITTERAGLIEEGDATVVGGDGMELKATVRATSAKSYLLRVEGPVTSLGFKTAAQVKMKTRSTGEPILTVGILLSKLAGLSIIPDRLNLGLAGGTKAPERDLTIRYLNLSKAGSSRVIHCPEWLEVKPINGGRTTGGQPEDHYTVSYRSSVDSAKSEFLKDRIDFEVKIEGREPLTKSVEVAVIASENK